MRKNLLLLLLLIITGVAGFLRLSESQVPAQPEVHSEPTVDYSQGAMIEVDAPIDIQQWVGKV